MNNTKNSMPFIKCSDVNTVEELKKAGFHIIDESNGITTFINDKTKSLKFDTAKIAYSNILTMDKP